MEYKRKKPELLLPAKDLEVLKTAFRFGADAVYIGGEAYSLRAKARNFSREDMAEGIAFAHARGGRVHVTANIFAHNADLEGAAAYFDELNDLRPDAVLVADPGMFQLAKEHLEGIDIHISTQANSTNWGTFRFWHEMGAKRVVCARELSLSEIRTIREKVPEDLEIEAFIHGAMCISYSGRCLLSSYFTGRDANRGLCTHPCRWKYALTEESRPGLYLPIEENERGTYILNGGDLCMIEHIPELMAAGIDSFKVEGRMKNALYVADAARAYRQAIDDCFADEDLYYRNLPRYKEEIRQCTVRAYTTGFYFGRPDEKSMIYGNNTYDSNAVWLGIAEEVRPDGAVRIRQRNRFFTGDAITVMRPDGKDLEARCLKITDLEGSSMDSAPHPKQDLWVWLDAEVREGDILRSRSDTPEAEPGAGTPYIKEEAPHEG